MPLAEIHLGNLLRDQPAEAVPDQDRLLAERLDDPPRVLDIVGDGEAVGPLGADAEPAAARAGDAPPAGAARSSIHGREMPYGRRRRHGRKERGTVAAAVDPERRKSG